MKSSNRLSRVYGSPSSGEKHRKKKSKEIIDFRFVELSQTTFSSPGATHRVNYSSLTLFGVRVSWFRIAVSFVLGFLLWSSLYSVTLLNRPVEKVLQKPPILDEAALDTARKNEIKRQLQEMADMNANRAIEMEMQLPHFIPTVEPSFLDVTLVTQLSPNYLREIDRLVTTWQGPMSVAIYVREKVNETRNMIEKLRYCSPLVKEHVHIQLAIAHYYEFELPDDFLDPPSHLYICDDNYTSVTVENFKDIYPQNRLRNIGRNNVKTAFSMVTDADILPSAGLRESFVAYAKRENLLSLRSQKVAVLKTVWVIPVFELDSDSPDATVPADKAPLEQLFLQRSVRAFYSAIMKELQATTNYGKWFQQNEPYTVPYTDPYYSYEPFFISWFDSPPFDERFIRWGFDRRALVYELYVRNYTFTVMSDQFLVHIGFKHHVKEQSVMENHYFNAPLWVKFKKEKDAIFKASKLGPYSGYTYPIQSAEDERSLCTKNPEKMDAGAALFVKSISHNDKRNDSQWFFTAIGEIRLKINQLCAGIVGEQLDDGVSIVLWHCHGGMSQRWLLNATGEGIGSVFIVSLMHNKCLTINTERTVDGSAVAVYPCALSSSDPMFTRQRWLVRDQKYDLKKKVSPTTPQNSPLASMQLRRWEPNELWQWCVAHNLDGEGRKSLVALSVGNSSKPVVNDLIRRFGLECFDYILFLYDESDWSEYPWFPIVTSVRKVGWYKIQFAKDFLTPDSVKNYEFVFLWDDDILTDSFNVQEFMCIMRRHSIEMAQPALHPDSVVHWGLTKQRTNILGRWVDGVEVMCMVFTSHAWIKVYELMMLLGPDKYIYIGWQMDILPWRCVVGFQRIAIIDHTPVIHKPTVGLTGVVTGTRRGLTTQDAEKKKKFEAIVKNDVQMTDFLLDASPACKGQQGNGGYLPEFYRQCWDPTRNAFARDLWSKIEPASVREYWLKRKCNSHPFDLSLSSSM